MVTDRLPDLAAGGVCAWRLPADETGPAAARTLLNRTMSRLGLGRDVIEDGELAVSETATNALRHARPCTDRPHAPPELWVWARTLPAPQLVVSVFDHARDVRPRTSGARLLDDHGKGLGLLSACTAGWGSAPSRSRTTERPVPGKTVWFALPLPDDWPGCRLTVSPGTAAQCLLLAMARRGFDGRRSGGAGGISVVELPGLNVWVLERHFTWRPEPERFVRRPLVDLQETVENLVGHFEGMA